MEDNSFVLGIFVVIFLIVFFLLGIFWAYPNYSVWQQGLAGEAELKRAESNRKIAILEAEAKFASAKQYAQAEVERAKGVAEANKIIGESLKDNESYLRYLWVNGLQTTCKLFTSQQKLTYHF